MDGIERVIGLDVHEPARRMRRFEFHRVDVASSDLTAMLDGVDTIVHLAGVDSGGNDGALLTHVNVEGTRKVLEAAATVGVRRIVQISSAAVYGAWPNNPRTDHRRRPRSARTRAFSLRCTTRRTNAGCAEWCDRHPRRDGDDAAARARRRTRRARPVRPGRARTSAGRRFGARTGRSRSCTSTTRSTALALAVERDLDGAYNVAADGWITERGRARLVSGGRPALPDDLARRVLRALWSSGLGDAPPEVLPYLVHPWVVANDRLRAEGWAPRPLERVGDRRVAPARSRAARAAPGSA